GNQGDLNGINAPLSVDLGIGDNTMVVSDFGQTSKDNNATVTATEIKNFVGSKTNTTMSYAATGGSLALELDGSNSRTDKFTVIATSADVKLTLKGNAGNDTFVVGNVLSDIQGPVKIIGGGDAGDATQVDDTGRDTGAEYVVGMGIDVDGNTV